MRAALGTRHGKGPLIAPALLAVGVRVGVVDLDTDAWGTFSGDVPRPGTPAEVVLAKARAAAGAAGVRHGLASEGSFHASPDVPFLTVDTELVALVDTVTGVAVVGRAARPAPWAWSRPLTDVAQLDDAGFLPASGAGRVVVRPADGASAGRARTDLAGATEIRRAVADLLRTGPVVVEPDLRADRCAPRREVIAAAAADLAHRWATRCPACGAPGFGVAERRAGLCCSHCGGPTLLAGVEVLACPACDHREERVRPGTADPGACPACNP